MKKNDLINDMNFRYKCGIYGLGWKNFNILDDIIVLDSPKENILVIFDEHYNTIGICDKNDDIGKLSPTEKRLREIKKKYEIASDKLPYPFQDLSLKQIVELSNRILINETSHGHSSDMIVNGELANDEHNSIYISLLLYIKFLGQQIEQYFMNLYQMKMMGFEYPDVYEYIERLMNNIDKCIEINIKKGVRPFPIDIIKYLGQDRKKIEEYDYELYRIIDLLFKQKGGFEHNNEIEIVEKDVKNLSALSMDLLKILEVSDEEVESRYQESNKTFEIKKIDLQSWLSESINKDKPAVLTKLKK